ncbi:MAG: hypothetical protein HN919_01370 [Verrucomicrobia bacterium]|jgi:hypothetical protein|nr:hypothetical protein [Verrucomicrobiota bacterium]MBT7064927.1 hypothetical protein [Verrucomicrobiota bacterium]MBT7699902.1 hypothetical protein [Verrucomicrobiota bacterium]
MLARRNRVVVDGVMDMENDLRWWQVPVETDRTHRGVIRRVLMMLI